MSKIAKLLIAAVLFILALASMGMMWIDDSSRSQQPDYCAYCHAKPAASYVTPGVTPGSPWATWPMLTPRWTSLASAAIPTRWTKL